MNGNFSVTFLIVVIIVWWILLFVIWSYVTLNQNGYAYRKNSQGKIVRTNWTKTLYNQVKYFSKPLAGVGGYSHLTNTQLLLTNPYFFVLVGVISTTVLTIIQQNV